VQMVLEDRGKYIAAALTICRAYVVAGRPDKADPLGSFEEWSDTVRSALTSLGEEDPVKSIEAAREEDPERNTLRDMLAAWVEIFGFRKDNEQQLSDVIEYVEGESPGDPLHDAVKAVALKRSRGDTVDAKAFGYWMRGRKGKPADLLRFDNRISRG